MSSKTTCDNFVESHVFENWDFHCHILSVICIVICILSSQWRNNKAMVGTVINLKEGWRSTESYSLHIIQSTYNTIHHIIGSTWVNMMDFNVYIFSYCAHITLTSSENCGGKNMQFVWREKCFSTKHFTSKM